VPVHAAVFPRAPSTDAARPPFRACFNSRRRRNVFVESDRPVDPISLFLSRNRALEIEAASHNQHRVPESNPTRFRPTPPDDVAGYHPPPSTATENFTRRAFAPSVALAASTGNEYFLLVNIGHGRANATDTPLTTPGRISGDRLRDRRFLRQPPADFPSGRGAHQRSAKSFAAAFPRRRNASVAEPPPAWFEQAPRGFCFAGGIWALRDSVLGRQS